MPRHGGKRRAVSAKSTQQNRRASQPHDERQRGPDSCGRRETLGCACLVWVVYTPGSRFRACGQSSRSRSPHPIFARDTENPRFGQAPRWQLWPLLVRLSGQRRAPGWEGLVRGCKLPTGLELARNERSARITALPLCPPPVCIRLRNASVIAYGIGLYARSVAHQACGMAGAAAREIAARVNCGNTRR